MQSNRTLYELEDETQKDKYLTFTLGKELFGIEVLSVTEIIGIQAIVEMPDLPESIRGIINLRGNVIPIMDLRTRLSLPPREYTDKTCIIISRIGDSSMGIIVDSVNEVLLIPAQNLTPPPRLEGSQSGYIKNIGLLDKHIILLLNCETVLYEVNVASRS